MTIVISEDQLAQIILYIAGGVSTFLAAVFFKLGYEDDKIWYIAAVYWAGFSIVIFLWVTGLVVIK